MSRKRFFFVGIPETHAALSISRAKALGFEVIVGDSADHLAAHAHLLSSADRCVEVDYTDYEDLSAVSRRLHEEQPLDLVFTFKEKGLAATARVVRDYGLVGNTPEVVTACIDKFASHERLNAAGLPRPAYALCRTLDEVRTFWKRLGAPVIVKPHNLQGSVGVAKVETEADLHSAYEECIGRCCEPVVLVEELLHGQEISMEAAVYHGEPVLFGVTEKLLYPGTFTESGHISPYDQGTRSGVDYLELVRRIVTAMGITSGPLHIEGFHTKRGFYVGEIHTRYGGDSIVPLTEMARKCDMTTPIFAELGGLPHEITFGEPQEFAAIRYLDVRPGLVQKIAGLEDVRALSGVVDAAVTCSVGDVIHPIRSSYDRVGWVMAKAANREAVLSILDEACRELRIVTA